MAEKRILRLHSIADINARHFAVKVMKHMFRHGCRQLDERRAQNVWKADDCQMTVEASESAQTVLVMMVGVPGNTHKIIAETLAKILQCSLVRQDDKSAQIFVNDVVEQLCQSDGTNSAKTIVVIADRANHTHYHRTAILEGVKHKRGACVVIAVAAQICQKDIERVCLQAPGHHYSVLQKFLSEFAPPLTSSDSITTSLEDCDFLIDRVVPYTLSTDTFTTVKQILEAIDPLRVHTDDVITQSVRSVEASFRETPAKRGRVEQQFRFRDSRIILYGLYLDDANSQILLNQVLEILGEDIVNRYQRRIENMHVTLVHRSHLHTDQAELIDAAVTFCENRQGVNFDIHIGRVVLTEQVVVAVVDKISQREVVTEQKERETWPCCNETAHITMFLRTEFISPKSANDVLEALRTNRTEEETKLFDLDVTVSGSLYAEFAKW
eukprot:c17755_g1_i1.p1 GENE.c17755_g1_i1~~c17755_g1_i1.p1  ORF type:complete len:474 (+),score=98.47 c17755_g1_i1:106-1422(+)